MIPLHGDPNDKEMMVKLEQEAKDMLKKLRDQIPDEAYQNDIIAYALAASHLLCELLFCHQMSDTDTSRACSMLAHKTVDSTLMQVQILIKSLKQEASKHGDLDPHGV